MNAPDRLPGRNALLIELLAPPAAAAADPNRPLLASMIVGRRLGEGCLPEHLGLGAARYAQLVADYFPAMARGISTEHRPGIACIPEIPEFADLQKLLLEHRAHERDSEHGMADIVATACCGSNHLWQDLALASRDELSRLMWINFPALARDNSGDMKWKKFLYRRLCAHEGIYVCPAPSCGECKDYAKCFGPER